MVYVQKIDLNTERETRGRQRESILARGRRDLSTQLTTRLDCGEYNLCTRSRGVGCVRISYVRLSNLLPVYWY